MGEGEGGTDGLVPGCLGSQMGHETGLQSQEEAVGWERGNEADTARESPSLWLKQNKGEPALHGRVSSRLDAR